MKKLFLLFFVICFCCDVIFAQDNNKNFEYYNSKIDSIVLAYSTEIYKRIGGLGISFYNSDLNNADKKKLIFKIRTMFEQDKYSNLYRVAHNLLYKMWYNISPIKNSTKIKQNLLDLNLEYYFYPDGSDLTNLNFFDLSIRNDYTERAKNRIFKILKDEKTQDEYNAWLLREKSIPENKRICESLAQWVINHKGIKNDTIIEWIKDSVCTEYISSEAKRMLAEEQIQPNLILMTGFLGMKECIPILQKNLQAEIAENKYYKDTEIAYRFALAKLGDKEQYRYLLDTFIYTHSVRSLQKYLSYFRDDKITWKFIDVSYHSSERIYTSSEDHEGIPSTIFTMDVICPYIKDLPKELNNPHGQPQGMKKYYDWEKRLYEWLMKNRDSIKFNYDINDGWFWSD